MSPGRHRFARIIALAALLGPAPARSQEPEEILSFDVLVDVREDATMRVTERILVRAAGQEIQRGIYRDFPTSFPKAFGLARIEAPFSVAAVSRDGAGEPYALSSIGGPAGRRGVRVRIGDPDVLLEPGVHEYTLEYETARWITVDGSKADLTWNVTGNGWSFPIRNASARIRVPTAAGRPDLEAWTGPAGSTASDVDPPAWDPVAREARFRTTRVLAPGEGLTVRAALPESGLRPPTEAQRAAWFRLDWGGYVDAGWVVLIVVAIYLLMWRRVGMDPPRRETGPISEPPLGFSPAALGYLQERGYRSNHLAAALVGLAVKGALRIERTGKTWTLHRTKNVETALDLEEQRVVAALFEAGPTLELSPVHHARLRDAISGLRKELSRRLEVTYFVNNRRWFLAGLGSSVVGFALLAWRWRFSIEPPAVFLGLWLTGWTAGVATMLLRAGRSLRDARRGGGAASGLAGGAMLLFSLPFLAAELVVAFLLLRMVPPHVALAAALLGLVNIAFYHLLERPTLKGAGVLDRLEGFRAFLEAEKERRLAAAGPGNAEVELFERYLPHAIALGVERRWAEGFGTALTPALRERGVMPWYTHDSAGDRSPSAFAGSLGSALASTLSSASTPPGSSSGGGGGGGSSGGGGGGGGGGGW